MPLHKQVDIPCLRSHDLTFSQPLPSEVFATPFSYVHMRDMILQLRSSYAVMRSTTSGVVVPDVRTSQLPHSLLTAQLNNLLLCCARTSELLGFEITTRNCQFLLLVSLAGLTDRWGVGLCASLQLHVEGLQLEIECVVERCFHTPYISTVNTRGRGIR
jgi:hypothetical protein